MLKANIKRGYTIAIDLGQSSVVVAAGYKDERGALQIAAISTHRADGVKAGRIENIAQVNIALSKGIAEIEKMLNVKLQQAYGGVSGELVVAHQHNESINVEEPDNGVSMVDISTLYSLMERVRPSERDALLESMPQNYVIDKKREVSSAVGAFGRVLSSTFNFITCEKESLSRISRAYTQAGITLKRCFANSVVAAEAVLTYDEKDGGVAVVDLGDGMTNVSIYNRGTLRYLGSIPVGTSAINSDLKSLMIQERDIERLKCEHGVAMADKVEGCISVVGRTNRDSRQLPLYNLATVIESRMMDIIELVKREIRDSGYAERLPYGVVLTGGGANLKLVDDLFERELGLSARVATPEEEIGVETLSKVQAPEYATIVGLLRRGVEADDKGVGKSCTVEVQVEEPSVTESAEAANTPYLSTSYQSQLSQKGVKSPLTHEPLPEEESVEPEETSPEDSDSILPPFLRKVSGKINTLLSNQGKRE